MGRNDHSQPCGVMPRCDGERGAALIVVLAMLLLLSILGATMLASTTSDLKIAGNYRNSLEAFYTADAAVSFAQTFADIYTSIVPGPNNATTWPPVDPVTHLPQGKILSATNLSTPGSANTANPSYNRLTIPGTNDCADVQVALQGSGNLPVGIGTQEDAGLSPGTSFKANNFVVNVIAYGPNNSTAQIESQICRVVQQ